MVGTVGQLRNGAGILLMLLCAGWAQAPRRPAFRPPDGHWWLTASAQARDGFVIGAGDWDIFTRRTVPHMSRLAFAAALTRSYRQHPGKLGLAVTTVISALQRHWRRTGKHRFVMVTDEYTGDDIWWNATAANQDGIILGFLACQAAEQGLRITIPVKILVQRVSAWYGVVPGKDGVVNPKTINDKLSAVILRAERQGP